MNADHQFAETCRLWQEQLLRLANLGGACAPPESAARALLREERGWRLYRYGHSDATPLLIVFALINRPTVLDLTPRRSLVRELVARDCNVHLLEWRDPAVDHLPDLTDYLLDYLPAAVRAVQALSSHDRIDLLGVCQGGVFALCQAALEPDSIRRLITMVTPADFHTADNVIGNLLRRVDTAALECRWPRIPAALVAQGFVALKPCSLGVMKYLEAARSGLDEEALVQFVSMERWIHDGPDLGSAALHQFTELFIRNNALATSAHRLADRSLELRDVSIPVLNVYAARDHLVPPSSAVALRKLLPRADYRELSLDTGHIGMYVSETSLRRVPGELSGWLNA